MRERFAIPCVGAIIERDVGGQRCVLVQTRQKAGGGETNGLLELPAGKVREYEDLYDAVRREVREETGLTVTKIHGEEQAVTTQCGEHRIRSCRPYCLTQNLSGAYSILLHTFLCETEGEPLAETGESRDIRWMPAEELRTLLREQPDTVFFLHLNALHMYFGL